MASLAFQKLMHLNWGKLFSPFTGKWRIVIYSGIHRASRSPQLNRIDTSFSSFHGSLNYLVLHLLHSIPFNLFHICKYPYHSGQYLASGVHKVKNRWIGQTVFIKNPSCAMMPFIMFDIYSASILWVLRGKHYSSCFGTYKNSVTSKLLRLE